MTKADTGGGCPLEEQVMSLEGPEKWCRLTETKAKHTAASEPSPPLFRSSKFGAGDGERKSLPMQAIRASSSKQV